MVNSLRGMYPHHSAESFRLNKGSPKSLRLEWSWIPKGHFLNKLVLCHYKDRFLKNVLKAISPEAPGENYTLEETPQGQWWLSKSVPKLEQCPLGPKAKLFGGSGISTFVKLFHRIQLIISYLGNLSSSYSIRYWRRGFLNGQRTLFHQMSMSGRRWFDNRGFLVIGQLVPDST